MVGVEVFLPKSKGGEPIQPRESWLNPKPYISPADEEELASCMGWESLKKINK